MKHLQQLAVFIALFYFNVPAQAKETELVISKTKEQKMRYGMDYERLWYWSGNLNAEERAMVAKWSVVDTKIDYIRVAINSEYELEEGKLNPEAYTKRILPMMKSMQKANPKIKFFASPRPLNEIKSLKKEQWQPYPRWITGASKHKSDFKFDWKKCAEYLERYLIFMKKNGFEISFLDITNEWQGTSGRNGRLTGEHAANISNYLKKKLSPKEMPLIIAPSSWNYEQGAQWITSLNTNSKKKAIDIASSHNTDRTGTAKNFSQTVRKVLGKNVEIWNTEQHGWKSTGKQNEVTSFYYMLESIRAGFSGINGWLAIGTKNQGHAYIMNPNGKPKRGVKYFIFKKLSTTSNYGHNLKISKEPTGLSHTAALIKDDLMSVWAVNQSDKEVTLKITPKGYRITDRTITIPANSVCCYELKVR